MALLHYTAHHPAARHRSATTKKAIKPRQLEFRVCFVHDGILREKECRLNGVFFNEILQQEFAIRSAGKDMTRRLGKCFQTQLQYNNNTTYNFI